jgi:hypothetical protein
MLLSASDIRVCKVQVKSLCFIKNCAMKAFMGVEVLLREFLNSALDRGEWSASVCSLCCWCPLGRTLAWPQSGHCALEKTGISCLLPEIEANFLVCPTCSLTAAYILCHYDMVLPLEETVRIVLFLSFVKCFCLVMKIFFC